MSYLAQDGSLANEHHFYPQLDTALSIAKKNGRSGIVDAADLTNGLLTACSSTH